MTFEDIEFPVYRKYRNGKNYFKILNPGQFEELQVIGSTVVLKKVTATQFPEKMFIRDMIYSYDHMALPSTASEFNEFLMKANK